jgi:hypothetical protein
MRRFLLPCCLAVLAACSDLRPQPLIASSPPSTQTEQASAIRETISMQLNSERTEPRPAPVPGRDAAKLGVLPPLSSTNGDNGMSDSGAAVVSTK